MPSLLLAATSRVVYRKWSSVLFLTDCYIHSSSMNNTLEDPPREIHIMLSDI